ncbi:MAG: SusC/RagA family TonB-linked outer membrane protein [Bacteroidota bacterium]
MKKGLILLTILFTGMIYSSAQDTLTVSGVVLSTAGKPVPNVAISIEGSAMLPSISGDSGEFILKTVSGEVWVMVAPASGYKKKRIFLNNKNFLKIYLTPLDLPSGNDQLSFLARPVSRRNIVFANSDISVDDMLFTPSMSVDQHLQGRVTGMFVIKRSGEPGSGAMTTQRGVNSMFASNLPLYIVDGIPVISHGLFNSNLEGYAYNSLLSINPFDVSRMTVVKDPAISSVYGSKGSNGIVFIETLDPSVTQTTIDLDLRTGYSLAPSNLIPQLDASQHKTLMNEVLFSTGIDEEVIREAIPTLFMEEDDERYIDYQHNTNWQQLIFNNAMFYNMNLKVKGGDEIARYGLSFGYNDAKGIIKSTGYQGYNLRFVSLLNIFTWLKMNAGVSLNYNSASLKESAAVKETSPILTALAKSPMLYPYQYDADGKELTTLSDVDEIGVSNPLAVIENYTADNDNYNFTASMGVEGRISDYFNVNSKFSFNYDVLKEKIFMPNIGMEDYYDNVAINVAKATNNDLTSLFNNTYLNFTKEVSPKSKISSSTGLFLLANKYQFDWGLTKNAHENDQYRTLADGQNNLREIGGANRAWNWLSFYENINYSLKDRYLFQASVSLDGSSRVGDSALHTLNLGGVPFGLFYSGGFAWRVSEEAFLKNVSWIEDLKLRVSAGRTGNDDIGESASTNYYQAVKFRETVGLYPAVIPNDKLTYETVNQINAGVDIALLGNRFSLTFDYFISNTEDMIINTPVYAYLGYNYLVENGGNLKNNGWELNTMARIVDAYAFKWDVNLFISSFNNEITEIKGDKFVYPILGGERVNMPGYPANSFYGFIYDGVFSTTEEATTANLINEKGVPFGAGDARFRDISGPDGIPDNVINDYDKTVIGSPLPDYFGGFTNTLIYKNLSLSATIQAVYGNELFNYVRYRNESMTGLENQSSHVLNRWQYEGQVTDVPRALYNDPIGNSSFSSRWIEDGSYLRIKNITLSYNLPKQFGAFRSALFYVSVNNILTFSNYLGYDPEFAYSYSQVDQGIDYGLTPQPRQFIAGIKFGL